MMPQADVWVQFSIVAILVLAVAIIAFGFFRLWRELMDWQAKQEGIRAAERKEQDEKRDQERDKQRLWEASQAKVRDEQWQSFLKTMQEQWVANDKRNSDVLEKLVNRIDDLNISLHDHDTFVRASSNASAERPARSRKQ